MTCFEDLAILEISADINVRHLEKSPMWRKKRNNNSRNFMIIQRPRKNICLKGQYHQILHLFWRSNKLNNYFL
jgi:hypothetical protein